MFDTLYKNYIDKNHVDIYLKFIKSRKGNHGLYERHYIVSKSLGINNDIGNIIKLYPREHYITHIILIRNKEKNTKK